MGNVFVVLSGVLATLVGEWLGGEVDGYRDEVGEELDDSEGVVDEEVNEWEVFTAEH